MSIIKTLGLGMILPIALALAQAPGATGTLSVTVTDPQGVPLPGALVSYTSTAPSVAAGINLAPAPGEIVVNATASADASGALTVAGLPPAIYSLCASVPSSPYIDPCVWQQSVTVTISAGTVTSSKLVLQEGVYLNVRVNDPMGLLPQAVDGPWTPHKLLAGVAYGTGAYQGAQNTSVDPAGRDYQLIIPVGVPFILRLLSNDVALADASGAALTAPAAHIPFEASAGQDQSFTFTVSGPSLARNATRTRAK